MTHPFVAIGLLALVVALLVAYWLIQIPRLPLALGADPYSSLHLWLQGLHQSGKFNGSVLLARGDQRLFSRAYGDNGQGQALDQQSSFNLASVSKQFTAMGILLCQSQGKLNVNDPLAKHIPELSHYAGVRLEHLLQHSAGLPDYMRLAMQHLPKGEQVSMATVIELLQRHRPKADFAAGDKFAYSNTGYVLLAEVVQRASGTNFEQFMQEQIFSPAGMTNSRVFNQLSETEPKQRVFGFARSVWPWSEQRRSKDLNHFDGVSGDGAVYASANDLWHWHRALLNHTLLKGESYAAALQPGVLNKGKVSAYGYGWFLNPDGSMEHAGGWQGFSSYLYRNPDNGDLIVILDNASNALRVNAYGFLFNSIGLNLKRFLTALPE